MFCKQNGEVLCKQGDVGDELYLVMKGQVNAYRDGQYVTSCTAPFLCGELAVMYNETQGATITVSSTEAEVSTIPTRLLIFTMNFRVFNCYVFCLLFLYL